MSSSTSHTQAYAVTEQNTPHIDETLPPIVQEFLRKGYQLEQITLHADGHWTHRGQPFENKKIVTLFNYSVARTPGGTWVIDVGQFVYPITVEDCGYFIERMEMSKDPVVIHLSDGTKEDLDFSTVHYEPEGRLYCKIKGGTFRARFKRAPYHALAEHIEAEDNTIYLIHGEHRIALSALDAEA